MSIILCLRVCILGTDNRSTTYVLQTNMILLYNIHSIILWFWFAISISIKRIQNPFESELSSFVDCLNGGYSIRGPINVVEQPTISSFAPDGILIKKERLIIVEISYSFYM